MYLILGFTNRTSYAISYFLLKEKKISLVIADQQNTLDQQKMISELSELGKVCDELGGQDPMLLSKYPITKIFISPGVPRSIPLIQKALVLGIEVLNDIEYFYQLFPNRSYIGITGTDGKTTVTTWIGLVLSKKYSVVLVGNIGTPIFEYYQSVYNDCVFVVELSSFQIESLSTFSPYIALVTNIQEDHLDRYKDFQEYADMKKNIFLKQTPKQIALINGDDELLKDQQTIASKHIFSLKNSVEWYYQKGIIYHNDQRIFDTSNLAVAGIHNIQNALMVLMTGYYMNVPMNTIKKSLKEFKGVSHRLEFVAEYNGISFYNDSKATTKQAVTLALTAFDEPVLLLAGGQSKNIDFSSIKRLVQQKTKKVFLFGELAKELSLTWGSSNYVLCNTLEEAFHKAYSEAVKNDVILLSPGGASFDEFSSYSDRGEFFIELVQKIINKKK